MRKCQSVSREDGACIWQRDACVCLTASCIACEDARSSSSELLTRIPRPTRPQRAYKEADKSSISDITDRIPEQKASRAGGVRRNAAHVTGRDVPHRQRERHLDSESSSSRSREGKGIETCCSSKSTSQSKCENVIATRVQERRRMIASD